MIVPSDQPAQRAGRPEGPRPPRPWYLLIAGQWPLAVTLLLAGFGVVWAGVGHWKRGSFTIGVAFVVACILRAMLPHRLVGLLEVRSRLVDSITLGVLGGGIVISSLIVAPMP